METSQQIDMRQSSLTPREREIVEALLDGCTNRAIAARLSVREQTVQNALTVIYGKFHVRTRLQLAGALLRRAQK